MRLSTKAQKRLVARHRRLVVALASHVRRAGTQDDFRDMVQDGYVGLIEAALKYDPTCGPFAVYARRRIMGAVLDGLRSRDWIGRASRRFRARAEQVEEILTHARRRRPTSEEVARAMRVSMERYFHEMAVGARSVVALDAMTPAQGDEVQFASLERGAWEERSLADAQRVLARLPRQEAFVIYEHEARGRTLAAIARDLGVSESWVCQLLKRALASAEEVANQVVPEGDAS